ncbi:hypothetical protein JK167_11440 [Levilactobacillus brevis]|uniref:Uncharacterized protein n=1 Tax=Levilactobacillus brevis TaxID=1580 RepID=A0AA41ERA7_LEVBR|nr:hypothetical protein [Levilactobacillus brevis]MBS0948297.1 hypothetical protein [Levilactobacillus brevis]MBS1011442.1 hypothetical protein [Levilactobacillus brevis]
MKNRKVDAAGCLVSIMTIGLVIVSILVSGLYLMLAWSWVIVPIFKLPVLNYWGATGISIMWTALFQNNSSIGSDSFDTLKHGIIVDSVFMGVLWVVSLGI